MEGEQKNLPPWREVALLVLAINQILMVVNTRQADQELWKTVVQQDQRLNQFAQHLIEHQKNDILYKTALNKAVEKETRVLEEWIQKAEDFLNEGCN